MLKLLKKLWYRITKQVTPKEEESIFVQPITEFNEVEFFILLNRILRKRLAYEQAWVTTRELRKKFEELEKLGLPTTEYLLNPVDEAKPLIIELEDMAEKCRRNRKEHKKLTDFLLKNAHHQVFEQQDVKKIFFEF